MCSRGVWHLQKLVLRYNWRYGASAGCRDFVKTDLVPFAKRNPQVKIETASTRGVPTVQAEYLNGNEKVVELSNKSGSEVLDMFHTLRDSKGAKDRFYKKTVISTRPSIQGTWDPSTIFPDFDIKL